MTSDGEAARSVGEAVRENTQRLLAEMAIQRVIHVDDDYTGGLVPDKAMVIAALRSDALNPILATAAFLTEEEQEGARSLDTEGVIGLLESRWDELDAERQAELTLAASPAAAPAVGDVDQFDAQTEQATLLKLPELLGGIDFVKLDLAGWRESGMAMIEDGRPTLLFFDRSFGEGSLAKAGDDLARGILARVDLAHVRLGVLTHTAEDIGREQQIADEISAGIAEACRPVIVIAKSRLAEGSFVDALRMTLYANELEVFRAHAVKSIEAASAAATEFVDTVERYALMATFEAARAEGSYETDNAIRMADAEARRVLAAKLRDQTFVDAALKPLRNAAAVDLYLEGPHVPSALTTIAWRERFDEGQYLSSLGMPIEVGDVFRLHDMLRSGRDKGQDRFYVLLAQPCDMGVRRNGTRSNGLRKAVLTWLHPAATDEVGGFKEAKGNQQSIGLFMPDSGVPWTVDFAHQIQVPTIALDACVMNSDGEGVIGPSTAAPCSIAASWEARLDKMRHVAGRMIVAYEDLATAIDRTSRSACRGAQHIAAAVAGAETTHKLGLTAQIDTANQVVRYGIERYARITGPTAFGLLTLSVHHHSRPAFDNDLFFALDEECGSAI